MSLLILVPLLLGLSIVLYVTDIPRKIGSHLTFEEIIRNVLFSVLNPQEMRNFRDDILHILESEIDENKDWDRWGLLREIDTAQNDIEDRLKDGEFAFTFVGGATAIIIGNVLGLVYGGIVMSIVGLIFSLLVAVRVIITDTLCYQSVGHRDDPLPRLALLKGWNRGPIFGTGAVGVAILSVVASRGGTGYRCGIRLLENVAEIQYSDSDRWRVEQEHSNRD
jgi:hypothetical protein